MFTIDIDGTSITATAEEGDYLCLKLEDGGDFWKRGKGVFSLLEKFLINEGYDVTLNNFNDQTKEIRLSVYVKNNMNNIKESVTPNNYLPDVKLQLKQLKALSEELDPDSFKEIGFERAAARLKKTIRTAPNPNKNIRSKIEMDKSLSVKIPDKNLSKAVDETIAGFREEITMSPHDILDITDTIRFALEDAQKDSETPKIPLAVLGKEYRAAIREGLQEGLAEADIQISKDLESRILTKIYAEIRSEMSRIRGSHRE